MTRDVAVIAVSVVDLESAGNDSCFGCVLLVFGTCTRESFVRYRFMLELPLTRLALISDHSIDTLIRDIVILEGKRTGSVLIEQGLEVIILSALVVVGSVVLKCKRSRRRRAINLIVDPLGGSLIDI